MFDAAGASELPLASPARILSSQVLMGFEADENAESTSFHQV
jgi:hypothetical protein